MAFSAFRGDEFSLEKPRDADRFLLSFRRAVATVPFILAEPLQTSCDPCPPGASLADEPAEDGVLILSFKP